MIVLDLEMTGVNPWKNGIVSIGAVDLEDPKREFYRECKIREGVHVDKEALEVNGFTEEEINDQSKKTEKEVIEELFEWIMESKNHTIAGQNPFFDVFFIQYASQIHNINFPLAHRSIDLHSVCFTHMIKNGITPPEEKGRTALNSDKIMAYVGIPSEPKPHNALNGAKWEAEALSRLFYNKKLYQKFAEFQIPWLK